MEARQVISKASSACTAKSSTDESPQEALEAAKAVMALTSPTKPLAEAILKDKANTLQVQSLHKALVAVTTWCISLAPLDDGLVSRAVDLCRRAQELSLPLHLPLYASLAASVARYSRENRVDLTILEVANIAVSSLHTPLKSSFFADSLLALVEQAKFDTTRALMTTMEERFDIEHLDLKTTIALMKAMEQSLQTYVEQHTASHEPLLPFNTGDVMNLFMELRASREHANYQEMKQSLDYVKSEEADAQELMEALAQVAELADDDEDDHESSNMQQGEEQEEEVNDDEVNGLFTQQSLKNLVFKICQGDWSDDDESDDEEDESPLPQAELVSSNEEYDDEAISAVAKQVVYLRDSTRWMLPDVTLQLVEFNDGRDVLYTRQYERQLVQEAMDNNYGSHF